MPTATRTLPRAEAQAIARALNRGAIGEGRVEFYASMARRGEVDAAFIDRLASPGRPHGVAGDDPDGGEDYSFLWPPRTAAEREERIMAAAAARAARAGEPMTDDEADALFPPEPES
jgi:hypothetical protein